MADNAYLRWMRDPDALARREEFAEFVGPNAKGYLKIYDRMHAMANRAPGEKMQFSLWGNGFNAGAFFVGPVWFFYRKMWWWGVGLAVALVALAWVPIAGRPGVWVSVGLALGVNQLYVSHAIATLGKMSQERGMNDRLPSEALRAAGGVSKTAGWIGGVVYVLLVALIIVGLFAAGGRSL